MSDSKKNIKQYDMDSVIQGISNPHYRPVGVHLAQSIYKYFQGWIDDMAIEQGWDVRLKDWDNLSADAQLYWYCEATQLFIAAHNGGELPEDLSERIERANPGLPQRAEEATKETVREQIDGMDNRFWN